MQTVNFNRACNCRVNQWSRVLRFLPKSLHYILHLAVVDGASTSRTSHLFHGCSVTQGICWTCLKSSSSSFIAFCSWTLFFQSCSKSTIMEVKVFVWQGCFAIRCAWNSRLSKSALPISSGTARRSFPYVWRHVHFALEQPRSWTVSIATLEQWLQSSAATPSKNDFVEDDWKHKHENRKASRFGLNLDTKRLLHCKQSNDKDLKPVKIEDPTFSENAKWTPIPHW